MTALPAPPPGWRQWLRALLAACVLVSRLALPLLPMPAQAWGDPDGFALAALLAEGAICHAPGGDDGAPSLPGPAPSHAAHDCGLCPVCHALSAPAWPGAGIAVLVPRVRDLDGRFTALPPATGPPARSWTPSRPRGPPTLRI